MLSVRSLIINLFARAMKVSKEIHFTDAAKYHQVRIRIYDVVKVAFFSKRNFGVYHEWLFISVIPTPLPEPCTPSPCGANAICKESHNAASCTCYPGYFGDPYVGCRPECVQNSDCAWDLACVNNKCVNPCSGACGINAECKVVHHTPSCFCLSEYTGNPLTACRKIIHDPSKAFALFVVFRLNICILWVCFSLSGFASKNRMDKFEIMIQNNYYVISSCII